MELELIDLSSGVRESGSKYVASNGVVVTTNITQYSNSNYYYLNYLFNNSFSGDNATHYWLGSGGNGGYLYFDLSALRRVVTVMRIYPYTRSDSSSNYRVDISRDGVVWDEATTMILNHHSASNVNYIPAGRYREHVLPYPPKHIRIYITYQGSWGVSLNEIQLFHPKIDGKFLLQSGNTLYKFREKIKGVDKSENLIPKMDSNLSPQGKASASSSWDSSSYAPYRAFDRNLAIETDCWHTVNGARLPQWIAYEFVEPQIIKRFSITSRYTSQATQSPRDFIIQGRKSGENTWHDIKEYTQPNGWASNVKRDFDCSENTTEYIEYRLYITANTAGVANTTSSAAVSIASLEMYGDGTDDKASGFEEFPANMLSAEFMDREGEELHKTHNYSRSVRELDFITFDRTTDKELDSTPFKESKVTLDLKKLFDIRGLN